MSFQQKNVTVSLINFTFILCFFLIRVAQLVQNGRFIEPAVFRLWGIVIALAVGATILGMILTHIGFAIVESIRTGSRNPEIEDFEDERDRLIDLRGTKITYTLSSLGVLFSMLAYVFGQPALVMFTLLIFFGVLAQIVGDVVRLVLYRRGF